MCRSLEEAAESARIHRLLANPRRLLILWLLEADERSVGDLAEAIGASLQSTSQHLRLLREHGLVCARRDGQTVYYTLDNMVRTETALRIEPPPADQMPQWGERPPGPSTKEKTNV